MIIKNKEKLEVEQIIFDEFTMEMLEEFARELSKQPIYGNGYLKNVVINRHRDSKKIK